MIDPSIFFARFFSVLCFPLTVWVAAEVSRRYLKEVNPYITAAIVVVHQQVVWNSLDIRLYMMMTLLSGLLLVLFYDGYLSEEPKKRARVLYTIVAIVSLYTQYYIGFQLFAAAFALLMLGRWRALGYYLINMAIAGVVFVPMLFIVVSGQMGAVTDQIDAALPITSLVNGLYQRIVPLVVSINWIEHETLRRWLARVVMAFLALLFFAKILRERKAEDIAIGAISVVMVACFLAAYAAVGDQLIQQRHLSGLILPMVIIPLSALTLFRSKLVVYGWLAVVIGFNSLYLYGYYKPLAKPGDFERMAAYVMQNEQPNQPVLVFHADAVLPLRFYYQGTNKLVPIPQENGTEVWNPRNNVLKDEAQILNVLNSQTGDPQQFWLVHDGWCTHGTLSFNCEILENVVEKYFVVERSTEFFPPSKVRLLRRR